MEKTTKKTTVAKKATAKKTVAKAKPVKEEKIQAVEPVKVEKPVKEEAITKKSITLNQEFNLVVGFLSLLTIIALCFEFSRGDLSVTGWEMFVYGDKLISGAFQGVMAAYVISLIIDCILSICIDSEHPIFDIVEKVLYMFTIAINFIVVATLLCVISNIGIGLIIFFILSIISVIIKLARIYTAK